MEENPSELKTRLSHIENRLSALEKGQAKQGSGWFQALKKLCFIVILGSFAVISAFMASGFVILSMKDFLLNK